MKYIIGKKISMSQIFNREGKVIPVTLIEAGPCFVAQIKTKEKDGYEAIQMGFGALKAKNIKKTDKNKEFQYLKECRNEIKNLKIGDRIDASVFQEGNKVKIVGVSKGKGFAGVVKRHGFKGGPASHGQKDRLRAPGSIGMSFPERVPKGRKMAGRMGFDQVTVKNLEIAAIDLENNLIALKGAVPGNRGSLVEIIGR